MPPKSTPINITDAKIRQTKLKDKDFKLSDGHGLYLLVKKNGSKYWRLKYRYLGKEKTLALGVYPEVSLLQSQRGNDQSKGYTFLHIYQKKV